MNVLNHCDYLYLYSSADWARHEGAPADRLPSPPPEAVGEFHHHYASSCIRAYSYSAQIVQLT